MERTQNLVGFFYRNAFNADLVFDSLAGLDCTHIHESKLCASDFSAMHGLSEVRLVSVSLCAIYSKY